MNGGFEIAPAGIVAFVTEMHEFVAQTHTLVETPLPGFSFLHSDKAKPTVHRISTGGPDRGHGWLLKVVNKFRLWLTWYF